KKTARAQQSQEAKSCPDLREHSSARRQQGRQNCHDPCSFRIRLHRRPFSRSIFILGSASTTVQQRRSALTDPAGNSEPYCLDVVQLAEDTKKVSQPAGALVSIQGLPV